MAGNRFDTVVVGLNDFPEEWWPPLFVHTLFNAMVGIGVLLILIALIGVGWKKVWKKERFPKTLPWIFVISGPLAIIGIEYGWIFACTGRQPWVIYRVLPTAEAATTAANLGILFVLFFSIYVILGIAVVFVLLYYFRKHPVLDDLKRNGTMISHTKS